MLLECKVGQGVQVTLPFFDVDGVTPKDPGNARLQVKHPDGTLTTYTYLLAELTKVSVGVYTGVFTPTSDGRWYVRGDDANGTLIAVDEDFVLVNDSQFS